MVTQVITVVSRDFFFGLGNLFSHKSIGKLLICEMMVRRTVFVRLLSSKLLLWVYNIITTMASTASIWPASESFFFDASLPCRMPLPMLNCKSIFSFYIWYVHCGKKVSGKDQQSLNNNQEKRNESKNLPSLSKYWEVSVKQIHSEGISSIGQSLRLGLHCRLLATKDRSDDENILLNLSMCCFISSR